jgi:SET domain-containing protein
MFRHEPCKFSTRLQGLLPRQARAPGLSPRLAIYSQGEDRVKIRVWVGTSRIAGKGLFAAQAIKKGTRILQYIGAKITKAEAAERLYQGNQYIFEFNERYNIDGKTLKNKARYINHSCDPNCEIYLTPRTIWIVAKRDIQEGEELSYNYGFTARQYRCQCGAKHCCGYILGEEYWDS